MRRFRWQHRLSKTRPEDGRHALAFGVRVGYWPCLRAPFIVLEFMSHRLDLWHGLPSHEN